MSIKDCAALVEKGDPDRFAATMAAPVKDRAALFVLYAFNLEVARAPFAAREPMIAEMRVQWWADILTEASAGRARKHEVAEPLAALIAGGQLPVATLHRLIDARRHDCWREPFADMAALSEYLEDTGAGLMWTAAASLGAPADAEAPVRALGWAAAAASYLQALPELEARGMPLVPGGDSAGLARLGLKRLAEARRGRRTIGAGRSATLAGWQAGPVLARAAKAAGPEGAPDLQLTEFQRRGRLLWVATTGKW